MDACLWEMKVNEGEFGSSLKVRDREELLVYGLLADDIVVVEKTIDEFDPLHEGRNLKVNIGVSKEH